MLGAEAAGAAADVGGAADLQGTQLCLTVQAGRQAALTQVYQETGVEAKQAYDAAGWLDAAAVAPELGAYASNMQN